MTLITFYNDGPVFRDGKIGTEQACCCSGECPPSSGCYPVAADTTQETTGQFGEIPMWEWDENGDPVSIDCLSGSDKVAQAWVRALDPPPGGITWKSGIPRDIVCGNGFWYEELLLASNYTAEGILGSTFGGQCYRTRTRRIYRLFYIDHATQQLVEVTPSTVANGPFQIDETSQSPTSFPGQDCQQALLDPPQPYCPVAEMPGVGDLPASAGDPVLLCPP